MLKTDAVFSLQSRSIGVDDKNVVTFIETFSAESVYDLTDCLPRYNGIEKYKAPRSDSVLDDRPEADPTNIVSNVG